MLINTSCVSNESNSTEMYRSALKLFKFSDGSRVGLGYSTYEGEERLQTIIDETTGQTGDSSTSASFTALIINIFNEAFIPIAVTEDNIAEYKILDNGNLHITIADLYEFDNAGRTTQVIIEYEISSSGHMLSQTIYSLESYHPINPNFMDTRIYRVTAEYGTLVESELQADIDAYNASQSA